MSTQSHHSSTAGADVVLIDTHVHLYDCFDRTTFFDSAHRNFRMAAQSLGLPDDTPGCLMFAETSKDHAFESLIAQHQLDGGRWQFHPTGEGLSLVASLDGKDVLTVIAGRQVACLEGIEVLALCCNDEFTDGRTVERTIEKVLEAEGLPVLPYGVGKWTGARGILVHKLIEGPLGSRILLGDNAGRLALGGEPKQFEEARKRGIWILPGTDPLLFPNQATRVGRYGLVMTQGIDKTKPAASVMTHLEACNQQPRIYGRTSGLFSFLKLQAGMQLRKRCKKR